MITQEQLNNEMCERCLDEMYRSSQPSITLKELEELSQKEIEETGEPQPVYRRFYLSTKEYKEIVDKYLCLYNLVDPFKDYLELLINDMTKGCNKDKYIEGENGFPGYRGYESVPSLDNEIGKENLQKVVDFINMRKNFYRFNKDESSFRFTIMNYAPNSNKQDVIDYWKSQGKDIEIEDRDESAIWEVHYYGMTWDEWKEQNKDIED